MRPEEFEIGKFVDLTKILEKAVEGACWDVKRKVMIISLHHNPDLNLLY